ncbi:hypothetical protein QC763_601670 [Podospora pseudopauciseta]|uniref:Uncharacterized protein n=1 Tax=Podospora pseudopauciseta TaxID=2093780 RepID=A0ABR0H4M4_9PEZI|nr:hypothetical protein QC763_601670 [Podospora pseudopauciseta]
MGSLRKRKALLPRLRSLPNRTERCEERMLRLRMRKRILRVRLVFCKEIMTAGWKGILILGLRMRSLSWIMRTLVRPFKDMRGRLEGKNEMVSNLERDLTKVTADNSSIRKKLDDVKMGQRAAMDDLRREKAKVMEAETELEVVKARLEDANATNANFSKTEEALNDVIVVLRGRIARLTEGAEDNKLTERVLRAEISSLKSELQALEEQKEELRRSFRDSQSALSDSTEKVSALESDVVMSNKKLAMVKNSLAKEKSARAELVGNLKEEHSKRRDVTAELELLKKSSKAKVAPAGKRLNLANQKMIDLEDGIKAARRAAADAESKLDDAQAEITYRDRRLAAETDRYQKKQAELEEAERREEDYDPEHLYKQLEEEKANHAASVSRLEDEVADCDKELAEEKANHAASIVRFEAEVAERDNELAEEKARHEQTIGSVEAQKASHMVPKGELSREIANHTATANALTVERTQHQTTAKLLATEQSNHQSTSKALAAEQANHQNTINALMTERSNHQNTRTALATEQTNQRNTTNSLATEKMNQKATADALAARRNAHQQTMNFLASEQANHRNTANSLSSVKSQLKTANNTITSLRVSGSNEKCVVMSGVERLMERYGRLFDRYKNPLPRIGKDVVRLAVPRRLDPVG